MRAFLTSLGDFGIYSGAVLKRMCWLRGNGRAVLEQMRRVGVDSLAVVNLCAFFIGLVLTLQTAYLLAKFGAKPQVAKIVTAAFVKEIGPVFAAIMFAGRVGTGIAAEIGSMVVTEQVDAYQSFGVDPLRRLGAPRVLATAIMLPALTAIAVLVGVFAGYLYAVFEMQITGGVYLEHSRHALSPLDIVGTMTKGLVFGLLIGLVATYQGFRTPRATEAVGESTTKAMVAAVLVVLVADLFLTKFFMILMEATV